MEVGPLARMLVAYASGHPQVKALVDAVLQKLDVGPAALFSTLGRVAARGIETQILAEKMGDWVDALDRTTWRERDLRIHDNSKWDPSTWPADCHRRRLPRGAARRARPLGAHQGRRDRELPVRRPEHVERGPARRRREASGRTRRP